MKIFDCFMYFDEDLVLELRLNLLDAYIDYFVIVESKFNHKGEKRELKFDINKYQRFEKKIIYLIFDQIPNDLDIIKEHEDKDIRISKYMFNAGKRENGQRNFIINGLKEAGDEDLILISDVDEIPNLQNIDFFKINKKIIMFKQEMFYYKFNLKLPNLSWIGTKACRKKDLKSPQWLRNVKDRKFPFFRLDILFSENKYSSIKFIDDGGWHFTNIKTAEEIHYNNFHYNQFPAKTKRIYNPYEPKFDDTHIDVNYYSNCIGYIGRHVPRKRPELALMSVVKHNIQNVQVINMGVDNDRYENSYWNLLEKTYKDILTIIPFTSDKQIKEYYFKQIGANVHSAIYEPLGYVPLECLDRRIPLIVANIDGPKEIIQGIEDYVYPYNVDIGDYPTDINNCSVAIKNFLETPPSIRKLNAYRARQALDKFRPENIVKEWISLFEDILS